MLGSKVMVTSYFVPGRERASRVRDLFATIAPRYDLINDLQSFGLHRYWKRCLIRLARVQPGERALDLCCGTGDISLALSRCGAKVTGLDFSAPMLGIAQIRLSAGSTADLIQGDALKTPFQDGVFDVVAIGYGLRNLSSFHDGLAEISRVLRPGGRVLILDFGKPDNPVWRAVYFGYLRAVVPLFGWVFCRDSRAYSYILESLREYPAQRGVDEALKGLNFRNVQLHTFLGGAMSINYGEKPGATR